MSLLKGQKKEETEETTWSRLMFGNNEVDVCRLDSDKTMWLHSIYKGVVPNP